MTSKAYRKWEKPHAERRYQRAEAAKQQRHREQVAATAERIAVAITLEKRIIASGRPELLLRLAALSHIRLYDESIDSRRRGYAQRRQGDHYKVMHEALDHVLDMHDDIILTVNRESKVHILEFTPAKVSAPWRPVFGEDGLVLLPDFCRAQLREWGEPDLQYA